MKVMPSLLFPSLTATCPTTWGRVHHVSSRRHLLLLNMFSSSPVWPVFVLCSPWTEPPFLLALCTASFWRSCGRCRVFLALWCGVFLVLFWAVPRLSGAISGRVATLWSCRLWGVLRFSDALVGPVLLGRALAVPWLVGRDPIGKDLTFQNRHVSEECSPIGKDLTFSVYLNMTSVNSAWLRPDSD